MTKCKTLKELRAYSHRFDDGETHTYVRFDDLKEAVIKQVKYGLKYSLNFFKVFCEFHNITEEELKND